MISDHSLPHRHVVMVMVGTFLLLLQAARSFLLPCCLCVVRVGIRRRKWRERKKKAGEHWREIRIQNST